MPRIGVYRSVSFVMALALMAGLLMVLTVSPVAADTADLTATLTGDQEVPPADTAATGSASVAIDDEAAAGAQLCYEVASADLEGGAAVAAHIHEGAAGEAPANNVVVTLTVNADGNGSACAADADFNLANSGDPDIATLLADIIANPGEYYVNVHTETFAGGEIRGQLAADAAPRDVTVQVMKHNCADVATMAEFEAVEARAATNPTTPDAAFGKTVETVLECPTVVLDGDTQTAGAVAGGTSAFDFTVADGGSVQTLSTDSTYTQAAACEDVVMYDANRNTTLDDDVCLDLSDYDFTTADGIVTVTETESPSGMSFGALRFTPGTGDEASLVSAANGVIVLDTTGDEDGNIMLHVYNFAADAAPAPTATPVASELPDAAVNPTGTFGSSSVAILFGIMALASVGFLGLRTVAVRRNR